MKIGILTLPLSYNYGGILQAYALQNVLVKMGHDVRHINYPFKRKEAFFLVKLKRCIKKVLNKYPGHYIDYEERFNKWLPQISSNTSQFISSNINLTDEIKSFGELLEVDFDAIIVGSDQIWRPCMFQLDPTIAFLSFARNWKIKKIAYAASFGTSCWEYTDIQTKQCAELALLFNLITVREKDAVDICRQHLGLDNVSYVLDPTMLLEKTDYESLIEKANIGENEGGLFTYILDPSPSKQNIIDGISKKYNIEPFKVNSIDGNVKCELKDRIAQPVEKWLKGFADADFVVTDSFHACVFSIIFNKPFIVIANKQRGLSRFESLLSQFDLMDRLVDNNCNLDVLDKPIFYQDVNKKLLELRKKSISILNSAL